MVTQGFFQEHWSDSHQRPAGGVSTGRGFTISWQNGPLGQIGTTERREANGAFVEDIIQAVVGRLLYYQQSQFACQENAYALDALTTALHALNKRTQTRTQRNVEGTYQL